MLNEAVSVTQASAEGCAVFSGGPQTDLASPSSEPGRFTKDPIPGGLLLSADRSQVAPEATQVAVLIPPGDAAKLAARPFVAGATNGNLHINPDLRATSAWQGEPAEIKAARKREIMATITAMNPSAFPVVYYWAEKGDVLVGCDFFETATEMGLVPGVNYPIEAVPCESLQARQDLAVRAQHHPPTAHPRLTSAAYRSSSSIGKN